MLSVRSLFACVALTAALLTTVTCSERLQLTGTQASLSLAPQAHVPQAPPPEAAAPAPTAAPVEVRPPSTPPPAAKQTPRPTQPGAAAASNPPASFRGSSSVQQQLTNQARASAGLAPLLWNPCLAGVAQRHAAEMAQAGHIYHGDGVQQDLGCGQGFGRAGENVGMTSPGIDDNRIFAGFMNSPGHKANILGAYRYIGTAWVLGSDGAGYVSVEFAG